MGRRKSLAEDLVEIASYLPWWVSLVIAVVAWFALGAYAGKAFLGCSRYPGCRGVRSL